MAAIPEFVSPTIERIYKAYKIKSDNGWRPHLGASVIGRECDREVWSIFRWITKADHEGRILRKLADNFVLKHTAVISAVQWML